jgi:hypothetical protein
MARGWESKSVEEQQAEAAERNLPSRSRITPQEAHTLKKLEGLQLSRQRVLQQLGSTPTRDTAKYWNMLWPISIGKSRPPKPSKRLVARGFPFLGYREFRDPSPPTPKFA